MKWVSFLVSMTEIAILAKVVWDCAGIGRRWASRGMLPVVSALLVATTAWTCVQLVLALVISVPPLNVLVHGTLAVVAHSMGTLIGIDTMAMLAVGLWLVRERLGKDPRSTASGLRAVAITNIGLLLLWAVLLWVGVSAGARMATTGTLPWVGMFPEWLGPSLVLAGGLIVMGVLPLVIPMLDRRRIRIEP